MASRLFSVEELIPGGILPGDWRGAHYLYDTGECSRCGRTPSEEEVPLMLWTQSAEKMLRFCDTCLAKTPNEALEEDLQNYYRNAAKVKTEILESEERDSGERGDT